MLATQLTQSIAQLVDSLGSGVTSSVAYDTAWLALLNQRYPAHGFQQAYSWIERRQHADGSWGAAIEHYHDRIICTLAVLLVLKNYPPRVDTNQRIQAATAYLHKAIPNLHHDLNETINFKGLFGFLIEQVNAFGLDIPSPIVTHANDRPNKLTRLKERPDLWFNHPIAFSLECFSPTLENALGVLEPGGSLGASPAATAALLLNSSGTHQGALQYLQKSVYSDGGSPDVSPINLFETTWSLNSLQQAQAIDRQQASVQNLLAFNWQHWQPERGQSHSTALNVPDLDDSATAFMVLHWGGYAVQPEMFAIYERGDHFMCFPDESDPSLNAHLRLLLALKNYARYPLDHPWITKIKRFINTYGKTNTPSDKWHISPYYVYSTAIQALYQVDDELVKRYIGYIVEHQRQDGGWGYYQYSTAEETAYALQALLYWHRHTRPLEFDVLTQAAQYLIKHQHSSHTSLWIGKCLYTPDRVVDAAISGALYDYLTL